MYVFVGTYINQVTLNDPFSTSVFKILSKFIRQGKARTFRLHLKMLSYLLLAIILHICRKKHSSCVSGYDEIVNLLSKHLRKPLVLKLRTTYLQDFLRVGSR